MFSLEFLHAIRDAELPVIAGYFRAGARLLEIGGGTGYQARALAAMGFAVESIDIALSNYAAERVFPVREYDGTNIPFPDASFDIVFSSNVLEHVRNLDALQREIKRVLRPGGYCVHVLPSAAWRSWSNLTHVIDMLQRTCRTLPQLVPRSAGRDEMQRLGRAAVKTVKHLVRTMIPNRHGECGNALTEIYWFSRHRWLRRFRKDGFTVTVCRPAGLFYTGYMVLGARWPIRSRQRWARRLGSACVIYVVEPAATAPRP